MAHVVAATGRATVFEANTALGFSSAASWPVGKRILGGSSADLPPELRLA